MTDDLGFASAVMPALMAAWFGAKYWSRILPRGFLYSLLAFFCTLVGVVAAYAPSIGFLWRTASASGDDYDALLAYYRMRGLGWGGLILMATVFSACRFRLKFHPPAEPRPFRTLGRESRKAFATMLMGSLWMCILSGLAGIPPERVSILLLLGSGIAAGLSAAAIFRD